MTAGAAHGAGRTAPDGSPYPDRTRPEFERDVQAMFAHIARRYDWFDHLASLGQDYLWRPRAMWDLDRFRAGRPVHRVLDVGCGTGDFTLLAALHYPQARVVGADFTRAMLARARPRFLRPPAGGRVDLDRASALTLPFRDGTFDVVMSAFVARNLPRLADALGEARRVLAPGGTILILEITEPASPVIRGLFHRYFDTMVPFLGSLVRSAGPYRYLPESLRYLPDRAGMLALLRGRGFGRVAAVPQSLGIVTSYLGEVPPAAQALSPGAPSVAGDRR